MSKPIRVVEIPPPVPPPPILFLDIDGVLNDHDYDPRPTLESTTIHRSLVHRLNRVLDETHAVLVLSSAWRYLIIREAMTVRGFESLLRSHGLHCYHRLVGFTNEDKPVRNEKERDPKERGRQVRTWIREHRLTEAHPHAVVDDMNLGFDGMPFVQTDGKKGLTDVDVDRLIFFLRDPLSHEERK